MSIAISEFAGSRDIPEGTLRALVVRTTEPGPLAEVARAVGDSGGANLGVAVRVDHVTGAVQGSVFQLFGEDNAVIIEAKCPARTLWAEVDRRLNITITVRVSSLFIRILVEYSRYLKIIFCSAR